MLFRTQHPFTKLKLKLQIKKRFFLYNKRKTAVKWKIHQNSALSKALLGKF